MPATELLRLQRPTLVSPRPTARRAVLRLALCDLFWVERRRRNQSLGLLLQDGGILNKRRTHSQRRQQIVRLFGSRENRRRFPPRSEARRERAAHFTTADARIKLESLYPSR
jgi:hypothetical protein